MRPLADLLNVDGPAWPLVEGWVESAAHAVEVLPPSDERDDVLYRSQVTLRSAVGAVVHNSGGLLVDHGWLRVLGSGHPRLPRTLPGWNERVKPDGYRLIADDAVGGCYAINDGGLGAAGKDNVFFFAPDRLVWEDMGAGYADFLRWALTGDLAAYYATLRWPGHAAETRDLPGDQGLAIDPFPFAAEARDVAQCVRHPVPVADLFDLYVRQLAPEMAGLPPGTPFTVRFGG
jgi:hypothetical protein